MFMYEWKEYKCLFLCYMWFFSAFHFEHVVWTEPFNPGRVPLAYQGFIVND